MNINKLSIRIANKFVHLTTPSNKVVLSELTTAVNKQTTLPNKIKRKVCKEKHIPSFVNYECYIPTSNVKSLDLNI